MQRSIFFSFYLLIAFVLCLPSLPLQALKPRSKYFKSEEIADDYLTTHYNIGCEFYNKEEWRKAASEFEKVIFYFPCSDAAAEASYYLAVCYFEMKEYDFANEEFSNYLKATQHPAFFEDAVQYKFCIAEHFKKGKKRRPFKMRYLPKWISAQDSALVIYDEVVVALPNHEITVQALYSKAALLKEMREYRESVETYQTIIRRFSKNEIVPICYLNIADAYIEQSRLEFQNPDILALAELNVRKFKEDFPRDERVAIAEDSVFQIKELYAKGLCDLGLFYERLHKPEAAAIYYQSSIEEFPDTYVAQFCRSRLICLGYIEEESSCLEEVISSEISNSNPVESEPASVSCQDETVSCQNETLLCYQEGLPPWIQGDQEYVHYSLTKKREQRIPSCLDPAESPCEPEQPNCVVEGVMPSTHPSLPLEQEEPTEFRHYSVIKHRDQYVPCEN